MSLNLTQMLFDVQTTRGKILHDLNALEASIKEAIEAEHQERLKQHAEELAARYAHAPGAEDDAEVVQ
jgi:hypothetical protein